MKSCTPSRTSCSAIVSMSMPVRASLAITASAPGTSSSIVARTTPWSRNASMVAGGMVLTVFGPISSST